MSKDAMAFLDGETVDEPEVEETEQVEAEAPAEAEPEPEAKAEKPEAEEQKGEIEGETPAPEPQNDKTIPVTALLDEREKRQEAQRRFEEAERRTREMEAELRRLKQPKQEAPDWYDDPQKAAQFQSQTLEQQFQARMMEQSKFFAEKDFGADTVSEAIAYFDKHPEQSQQFRNHPSPFHAAVDYYQKQKAVEEIGSDPEAYRAKMREQIRAELEAELTQNAQKSQPSKPKAPPPSMASAPAAGGETSSPGNAFDEMFPG